MISRPNGTHHSVMAGINVTPLVDVMSTLLVIFMATAPLMQQGLPVNLPHAQASSLKRTQQDLIVTIQKNGSVFIGEDTSAIPMDEVEGQLKALFANKLQKDIFIKADTDIKYGDVVAIMSSAKKAGADRIGMITQPELWSPEK